jgi:exopolysaccharide biosynthesis WecB/TagA/CpsF family protein
MKKVRILNVEIDNLTVKELLQNLTKGVLVTPNVDDLIKNHRDKDFHNCVIQATYTVCDSKIVLLASKFLGTPLEEVIAGSDFFPAFYMYHAQNEDIKIFLLGAKEGIGEQARININKKVGREIVTGTYSPPFGFEKDNTECQKIVKILQASDANVVLVGLGNPKQTKWIFNYKNQIPNITLFLALGATIDFEAGNIKRAPKRLRDLALEWLYRMFKDPKRLVKRYLVDDLPFFYYLLKQRFGLYKDPFEK